MFLNTFFFKKIKRKLTRITQSYKLRVLSSINTTNEDHFVLILNILVHFFSLYRTVVRNRKNNISNYIRYNASTMQDDIAITERYHTLSKRDVRDKSSVLSQSYLIDR